MELSSPITSIKGAGEKTARAFAARNVFTVSDLICFYPKSHDFYQPAVKIADLVPEPGTMEIKNVSLKLTVFGEAKIVRFGRKAVTHFTAMDDTGSIRITFFNMSYISKALPPGCTRIFRGNVRWTAGGKPYMDHPQIIKPEDFGTLNDRLVPHYPPVDGVSDEKIRKFLLSVFDSVQLPEDPLTEEERTQLGMPALDRALYSIHFPKDAAELKEARDRLVFDEFLAFMTEVRKQKKELASLKNEDPMIRTAEPARLIEALPYALTASQKKAWEAIEDDLCSDRVMNRLLQGDVGSGKTIVAFLSLLLCASNGRQGAFMAPTEVLARQHMGKLRELAARYHLSVTPVLLTGSVKGKERQKALADIADGTANIVIGTHALIQEGVAFHNLSLVITDEQHRFGVRQREALSGKGKDVPILVMSATPIPRTLAMIMYGDLETSVLTEKPGGRLPVKNLAMPDSERGKALRFMLDQVALGRQAYIICPSIESAGEDLGEDGMSNVEDYYEELVRNIPAGIRADMLHGKMASAAKNRIMEDFSSHRTDILVSTTVIEVGIDVPNANVMIIENAERFGLSQLHQLRGRIGRGKEQSYCIFLYHAEEGKAEKPERLAVLEKTNDGFEIAEQDLLMRGPGDLFGQSQSGRMEFALGDIYHDQELLYLAADFAENRMSGDRDTAFWSRGSVDFRSI